jgi:hypothetical protein
VAWNAAADAAVLSTVVVIIKPQKRFAPALKQTM